MLKAYGIKWDVDIREVLEKLDDMSFYQAAEALEIPVDKYANMNTSERHDYAYDYFHHRHDGCKADFVGLPEEVDVPAELTDDEDISDWLSDEFGYCHGGFELKEVQDV